MFRTARDDVRIHGGTVILVALAYASLKIHSLLAFDQSREILSALGCLGSSRQVRLRGERHVSTAAWEQVSETQEAEPADV